jgi:hypothetical protein
LGRGLGCLHGLLLLAVTGFAQGGDQTIVSTPIATKPATYDVQAIIDRAKLISPTAGAAIQAAKDQGTIGFVEFDLPGSGGVHDYNTIGLNPAYGPLACAVSLLHEFTHVTNCVGGPQSGGGRGGDNRVTDPCYSCIHMQMNADSWTLISEWFCELDAPASAGSPAKVCELRKSLQEAAMKQGIKCLATTCTGYNTPSTAANWSQSCPNCP